MELEVIILSDGSQKEKDKYDITYMWNLTKQKKTHRHRKQIYGYQSRKRKRRDKLGVWD